MTTKLPSVPPKWDPLLLDIAPIVLPKDLVSGTKQVIAQAAFVIEQLAWHVTPCWKPTENDRAVLEVIADRFEQLGAERQRPTSLIDQLHLAAWIETTDVEIVRMRHELTRFPMWPPGSGGEILRVAVNVGNIRVTTLRLSAVDYPNEPWSFRLEKAHRVPTGSALQITASRVETPRTSELPRHLAEARETDVLLRLFVRGNRT